MTIPTANLGVFEHAQRKKLTTGDCDKDATIGNGNIHVDVLGANLAIFGSRSLSQSFS